MEHPPYKSQWVWWINLWNIKHRMSIWNKQRFFTLLEYTNTSCLVQTRTKSSCCVLFREYIPLMHLLFICISKCLFKSCGGFFPSILLLFRENPIRLFLMGFSRHPLTGSRQQEAMDFDWALPLLTQTGNPHQGIVFVKSHLDHTHGRQKVWQFLH